MLSTPRARWLVVFALTLCALALRLGALGREDLSLDETFTVQFARLPLGELFARHAQDVSAPLLSLIVSASLLLEPLLGLEVAARLPSALGGALAVQFVYAWVAGRAGRRAGLVAASFLAVHASAVLYAREIRFYALVMTAAALTHLLADRLASASGPSAADERTDERAGERTDERAIERAPSGKVPSTRAAGLALALGLAGAALAHLHLFGVFLLVPLALQLWRSQTPRRLLALAFGVTALALLPLAWLFLQQSSVAFGGQRSPISIRALEGVAKHLGGAAESAREPLVIVLPLLALGVLASWRARREEVWVAAIALGSPLLLFWLVPPHVPVHTRYFSYLLPLALLFVARGVTWLGSLARAAWGGERGRAVGAALALALVLFSLRATHRAVQEHGVPHRAVLAWLDAHLPPGGRVVLYQHGSAGPPSQPPPGSLRVGFAFYAPPELLERCVDPFTLPLDAPQRPTVAIVLLRPRHGRELESAPPGSVRLAPRALALPLGPPGEPTRSALARLAALDRQLPGVRDARWQAAFARWAPNPASPDSASPPAH